MHLTRPRSSKGRSRPAVDTPGPGRPPSQLRSRSQPAMSQDQVLVHMLGRAPAAPPQSLNKYRVLPSIGGRLSESSPGDGGLSDGGHRPEEPGVHRAQTRVPEGDTRAVGPSRIRPTPPDPGPDTTEEAGARGGLMLAIRAPCGSRFQQHFEPADTLQKVRASAEAKYGATYGEASIQTMDVPRRSFSDMEMTLAQCGILNRSVLCISQSSGAEVDPE